MAADSGDGEWLEFLKSTGWQDFDFAETDQRKGLPCPPFEKPVPEDARIIGLPRPDEGGGNGAESAGLGCIYVRDAINSRRSRRKYREEALSPAELSFLLWCTQGMRHAASKFTFRTVPSGGARHPFETYIAAIGISGLEPGLYRYLPLSHSLYFIKPEPEIAGKICRACNNQSFVADAAAVFVWAAIPYRTSWRYGKLSAKIIALDAGHICQNLYIACESIAWGTCAIGAYNQSEMDTVLDLDGREEFAVYAATVGKP